MGNISTIFTNKVISWYRKNKRDLPWRNTNNPYFIWLSEIILQQTRIEQGTPYYLRFIKKFPDVRSLAKADEKEVLKLWQGLGYYSRARNLHAAAKKVISEYKGIFPSAPDIIKELPGVGDYTTAAIGSIAFGLPLAVVDGNVYRLFSRFFGIKTPIDSSAGKKEFSELAGQLILGKNPAEFNQAIMEFGALHCKPADPLCQSCPLQQKCVAYLENKQKEFPVKRKKKKASARYFNYLIIESVDKKICMQQRIRNDIWRNMYEFPLVESQERKNKNTLQKSQEWIDVFGKSRNKIQPVWELKHVLSHQTIHASFFKTTGLKPLNLKGYIHVQKEKVGKYPVSRLIEKFLSTHPELF